MPTNDLDARLLEWVREKHNGGTVDEITCDTNLMERSVLDSVGFIELIALLEDTTGLRVDLDRADPDDLTSIRGLCALARKLQGQVR